jgi:1-deoxy-D-xylulose-5-phosphate reductoisomerase
VIAQLSVPDMRHCVQYALELPERHDAVIPPLDLSKIGKLSFADPDEDTFIPLKLARESLSLGGAASAVLHSANEVAVARFLEGKIKFTDIFDTLEYICAEMKQASNSTTLDEILECVETAACMADEYLARK